MADKSHGIIPFVILAVGIPFVFCMDMLFEWKLMWLLVGLLGLATLHFANEHLQSVAQNCVRKYGSYPNFVKNSKKDTKYFLLGSFIGALAGFLVLGILSQGVL